MSEPFLGELRCFGFSFPPNGWAKCDGATLPISQHTALFSLFGTMYGGNGETVFDLPELRGRVPVHNGAGPGLPNFAQGSSGGAVQTTLALSNIPAHSHSANLRASTANSNQVDAGGNSLAVAREDTYIADAPNANMNAGSVTIENAGGGQSFSNMQPYLTVNWCVALVGIYPSQ